MKRRSEVRCRHSLSSLSGLLYPYTDPGGDGSALGPVSWEDTKQDTPAWGTHTDSQELEARDVRRKTTTRNRGSRKMLPRLPAEGVWIKQSPMCPCLGTGEWCRTSRFLSPGVPTATAGIESC